MSDSCSRSSRAASLTRRPSRARVGWLIALPLLLTWLMVAQAQAQENFPRIGLSANQDIYVDHITVQYDTEFQLYGMVMGFNPGDPLNQPLTYMPWVIHQVCCGGVLEITDMVFNPALQHTGHPLAGTVSSVETCLDQDSIWLVTLTVKLLSSVAGDFLWAAGPFGSIRDCNGEMPFFMSMPVTITMEADATPTDSHPWGRVKAMYR